MGVFSLPSTYVRHPISKMIYFLGRIGELDKVTPMMFYNSYKEYFENEGVDKTKFSNAYQKLKKTGESMRK